MVPILQVMFHFKVQFNWIFLFFSHNHFLLTWEQYNFHDMYKKLWQSDQQELNYNET